MMTLSKWLQIMQPQSLTGLLALAFCLVAAKQNTMELRCHPSYGLVPSDGLASGAEFRACTRQTCHTDSLKIENGVALPSGPINIGSSVSISCNAGYQLDSAAAGGSAAPKCREHGFDSPLKCKRIQCQISNIDPHGVVTGVEPAPVLPASLTAPDFIAFDQYVRVTCNHGYMASDSDHAYGQPCRVSYVVECQADGNLSRGGVSCVPITCPPLPEDLSLGMRWMPEGSLQFQEQAVAVCIDDCMTFQPNVSSPSSSPNVRECMHTCQYTPLHGTCVRKSCSTAPPLGTRWNASAPSACGDRGTLMCNQTGFVFNSQSCDTFVDHVCNSTNAGGNMALLNPGLQTCVPATCQLEKLRNSIMNGRVLPSPTGDAGGVTQFGNAANITCNNGYRASKADFAFRPHGSCSSGNSTGTCTCSDGGDVSCIVALPSNGSHCGDANASRNDSNAHNVSSHGLLSCGDLSSRSNISYKHSAVPASTCQCIFRTQHPTLHSHAKDFSVECGQSHLGPVNYSPCAWRAPSHSCVSLQCPVWSTANGVTSATPRWPGIIPYEGDSNWINLGTVITVTCNHGFRISSTNKSSMPVTAFDSIGRCGVGHVSGTCACSEVGEVSCIIATPNVSTNDSMGSSNKSTNGTRTSANASVIERKFVASTCHCIPRATPRSTNYTCSETVQSAKTLCVPVRCEQFVIPPLSRARRYIKRSEPSGWEMIDSGKIVSDLLAGEILTLSCHDNHRVGGTDERCSHSFNVTCGDDGKLTYAGNFSASVPPENQTCVPIQCSVDTQIDKSNSVSSPSSGVVAAGEAINVTCNAGFRLSQAGSSGLHPVWSDPYKITSTCESASCSFGTVSCAKSGCFGLPRYTTVDGLINVKQFHRADGRVSSASDGGELLVGESFTVTCPHGYRVGNSNHVSPSASRVGSAVCTSSYNITRVECAPVTCGEFRVPLNSMAMRRGHTTVLQAGTVLKDLRFAETVNVWCDTNFRLSALDISCGQREFTVKCEDSGLLVYSGNTTSLLKPVHQQCVQITCSMPLIPNGERKPLAGMVEGGEKAYVTCNTGYLISPTNYTGKYPLCHHESSVAVPCDQSMCDFPYVPSCTRPGCYGMPPYRSTDSLTAIEFKKNGAHALIDPSEDGALSIYLGENYVVECAEGYRVADTPPARAAAPRSASAECRSNCQIDRVACSRVTCSDFTVPANSVARRNGVGPELESGEVITSVLFNETVEVTCKTNHRLSAYDLGCSHRAFVAKCNDDGVMAYFNSIRSWTSPTNQRCVPVECNVMELNSAHGIRTPNESTVKFGESAIVSCNAGYHVKPEGYVGSNALCSHPTNFSLTCNGQTCRFPPSPGCHARGCHGIPASKTSDGQQHLSYHFYGRVAEPSVDGQVRVGETLQVTCPVGHRVATTPPATPDLPQKKGALCQTDCMIAPVDCSPVTCGDFWIPSHSSAVRVGRNSVTNHSSGLVPQVLFNETLIITCEPAWHISSSTFQECQRSFSVVCDLDGAWVSPDHPDPASLTCVAPKKVVQCATCHKYWGKSTTALIPRQGGEKSFESNIDEHEQWARDSCILNVSNSTVPPCVPVLCRPLPRPEHVSKFVYLGVEFVADGQLRVSPRDFAVQRFLPEMMCGSILTVVCEENYVPESFQLGNDCTNNSFDMRRRNDVCDMCSCDGMGYWEGYQKCVPKMCLVIDLNETKSVAFGQRYNISCPEGFRLPEVERVPPVCLANCRMEWVQTCIKLQCTYTHKDENQVNTSAVANYGDNITIKCRDGYVAFDMMRAEAGSPDAFKSSSSSCRSEFFPTCQANGLFDHSQGGNCVQPSCPPYHSIDPHVKKQASTLVPFHSGATINVACKSEYRNGVGFNLNLSSAPETQHATPGSEYIFRRTCLNNCQWSPGDTCVPVRCRCADFDDFVTALGDPPDGKFYARLHGDLSGGFWSGSNHSLECPPGFSFDGIPGRAHCSDTCTISVSHALLCVPTRCSWSGPPWLLESPANALDIGEAMIVKCPRGYELTNEDNPDDAPPVVLEGLETLGSVKVIASMSFPPPPAGEATSYALAGAYSDISLDLPAGAWPSDLTVGPSIAIFEMPASDRRGQLAGLGVNLGPDGTHFAVPVTISAPVDSNLDLGNKELRIHRFTPKSDNATATWTPLPYPQDYSVPSNPTAIKAITSSFSAYFALAVDPLSHSGSDAAGVLEGSATTGPQSAAAPVILPASNVGGVVADTPESPVKILGVDRSVFIYVAAGAGGVFILCLGLVCYLWWRRRGKSQTLEKSPDAMACDVAI